MGLHNLLYNSKSEPCPRLFSLVGNAEKLVENFLSILGVCPCPIGDFKYDQAIVSPRRDSDLTPGIV